MLHVFRIVEEAEVALARRLERRRADDRARPDRRARACAPTSSATSARRNGGGAGKKRVSRIGEDRRSAAGVIAAGRNAIRSACRRRTGTTASRRSLPTSAHRRSRRGAARAATPRGCEPPTEERIEASSSSDRRRAEIVVVKSVSNSVPASAKNAPLKPSSRGSTGSGNCTSAVPATKMLPPSASSVADVARAEAGALEAAHRLAALEEGSRAGARPRRCRRCGRPAP